MLGSILTFIDNWLELLFLLEWKPHQPNQCGNHRSYNQDTKAANHAFRGTRAIASEYRE